MPAKRTTTSRTKRAAGLAQPTLSFQSQRKPSLNLDKTGKPALSRTPSAASPGVEEVHEIAALLPKADENPRHEKENKGLPAKRRQLDVKSKEWNALMKDASAAMGGLKPIHAGPETHNSIHHILRVFDMTSKYGPCVGITRLQRWERAKKWGLNPPDEIHTILTTEQGEDDASYRENVLHGWV